MQAQNTQSSFSNLQKNNTGISFIENKGQVCDQFYKSRNDIRFYSNAGPIAFYLRNNGVSYQMNSIKSWKKMPDVLKRKTDSVPEKYDVYRLDINWLNCKTPTKIDYGKKTGFTRNYYVSYSSPIKNVEAYNFVIYKNLYQGIDLKWYQKEGQLKYDYIVSPGADFKQIKIEFKGASKLTLKGDLIIETPFGQLIEKAPVVFQAGKQLKAKWVLNENVLSIAIDNYNPALEMIIDPLVGVRTWATYFGGNGGDIARTNTTDNNGNFYIGGQTNSILNIATVGAFQTTLSNPDDGFLAKFNPFGTPIWITYYGGNSNDVISACCCDKSNNIYVTGQTLSSGTVLSTPGCHQPLPGSTTLTDAFLSKFDENGNRIWGTYYGDVNSDQAFDCTTDSLNNVYMIGGTLLSNGATIATPGSFQPSIANNVDGFIVKFDSSGVRQWGTYFGGSGNDVLESCKISKTGFLHACGVTESTGLATPSAHQTGLSGNTDAILAKFSTSGSLLWCTYYGGSGGEEAYCCTSDNNDNVIICGSTSSPNAINTSMAHQSVLNNIPVGSKDGFLVKFNSQGVRLWGTYYGGQWDDHLINCASDSAGNIYFCGSNNTSNSGFIISSNGAYQLNNNGFSDCFFGKFNANGVRQWATFFGDQLVENDARLSLSGDGSIYISGSTSSQNSSVLTSSGCFQQNYGGGGWDCFLAKFNECNSPSTPTAITSAATGAFYTCAGNSATLQVSGNGNINWYAYPTSTNVIATGSVWVTPTISATGTYTYYAAATNTCNEGPRNTMTLNVLPIPVLTVNSGTLCKGNNYQIIPSGATSYTYEGGSNYVTPTVSTTYTVIGTNMGCVSGPATCSITVYPKPVITVNSGSICAGNSFTITPSGAATYTVQGNNFIISPTTNTVLWVTGTNSFGCVAQPWALCSVSVVPSPTLYISNNSPICENDTVKIFGGGGNSYLWNGPASYTSSSQNIVLGQANITQSGTYTLTAGNNLGCSSTALTNFVVNPAPNLIVSSSSNTICIGQSATLNVSGAASYTWNTGSNSNQIVVMPVNDSLFTVSGENAYGCIDSIAFTQSVSICAGLKEEKPDGFIMVYPNPFNDSFTIKTNKPIGEITVYNNLGQIVLVNTYINLNEATISLDNLNSGIYFLSLDKYYLKLVKLR